MPRYCQQRFFVFLRRNRTVLNEAYAFERRQNSKQTKSSSSKNRTRVPAGFEQTRAGSGFKKVLSGRVKFFGSGRVPGFSKTRASPIICTHLRHNTPNKEVMSPPWLLTI